MKQPKLNGRQARWCMFLIPFDFIIKHHPGKSNPADGPSRQWKSSEKIVFNTKLMQPIQQQIVSVQSLKIRDLLSEKSQFECDERPLQGYPELNTRIALSSSNRSTGIETAD
jgi:hypothetical protein